VLYGLFYVKTLFIRWRMYLEIFMVADLIVRKVFYCLILFGWCVFSQIFTGLFLGNCLKKRNNRKWNNNQVFKNFSFLQNSWHVINFIIQRYVSFSFIRFCWLIVLHKVYDESMFFPLFYCCPCSFYWSCSILFGSKNCFCLYKLSVYKLRKWRRHHMGYVSVCALQKSDIKRK